MIATKGAEVFVIDYFDGTAPPVPLVETLARLQYATL